MRSAAIRHRNELREESRSWGALPGPRLKLGKQRPGTREPAARWADRVPSLCASHGRSVRLGGRVRTWWWPRRGENGIVLETGSQEPCGPGRTIHGRSAFLWWRDVIQMQHGDAGIYRTGRRAGAADYVCL